MSSVVDHVIGTNYILSLPVELLLIRSSLPDNFLMELVPLISSLVIWLAWANKVWVEVTVATSKQNLEDPLLFFPLSGGYLVSPGPSVKRVFLEYSFLVFIVLDLPVIFNTWSVLPLWDIHSPLWLLLVSACYFLDPFEVSLPLSLWIFTKVLTLGPLI